MTASMTLPALLPLEVGCAAHRALQAYASQLERGSAPAPARHDRATSRALNSWNSFWTGWSLRQLAQWQADTRAAREALPAALTQSTPWLAWTEEALARQHSRLQTHARQHVGLAFAY